MSLNEVDRKKLLQEFKNTMHVRPNTMDEVLVQVLLGLLERYFQRVPDAERIFHLTKERGDIMKNDHIAFRSLDIRSLLKVFLPYGYQIQFDDNSSRTPFNFQSKKLTAIWLKHPLSEMPRIFISECRIQEIPELAAIVQPYLDQVNDPVDHLDSNDVDGVIEYLHTGLWPLPSYADYQAIQNYSEYVSWVLYNKYYLNHFTLTVNSLDSFGFKSNLERILNQFIKERHPSGLNQNLIQRYLKELREMYQSHMVQFNDFLRSEGFVLNAPSGKELNISDDGLLLQSSTKANMVLGAFSDGDFEIPGSYVEFAYRGILESVGTELLEETKYFYELTDHDFRDGFEVKNANNIFESTYTQETISQDREESVVSSEFQLSKDRINNFLNEYQAQYSELDVMASS